MERLIFEETTRSVEETEALGKRIAGLLKEGDFLALQGDLGAGKTALVRGICSVFCPGARVASPTYTVMRRYDGGVCPFYHFDMYRITSEEDLESVGFYDCRGVIAAEWCEKTPYALPGRYYLATLRHAGPQERQIALREIALP